MGYTTKATQSVITEIEDGASTYATDNTPRAQRITNGLEHAAQNIPVPLSANMKKWIKFYFDILLHDTIDGTVTTITSDVETKIRGLREVVQLRPFSETEKSTIKLYADHFGYTYTPTTATPTPKTTSNATTPIAITQKPNYKTIVAVAAIAVVAIAGFFLFRKKRR